MTESPFTLRDYKRFGLEIYRTNNYEVEVWDLTALFHPDYGIIPPDPCEFPGLKIFKTKKDVLDCIAALNQSDFVLNLNVSWMDKLWFYRAISKNKVKYGMMSLGPVPMSERQNISLLNEIYRIGRSFKFFKVSKYISLLTTRLKRKIPFGFLGVSPAALMLASGEMSLSNYYFPLNEKSEIVWLHVLDYDLYLEEQRTPSRDSQNKAVFLDVYMPFHPDFVLCNEKNTITPEKYYLSLNRFFDYVEKEQNTSVEIAAHPRSDYPNMPSYFGNRRIIIGKTIESVRTSRFIISHHSTALNMAILYQKPVIFVVTDEMIKGGLSRSIYTYASWFGKVVHNIDKPVSLDWDKELTIDKEKYAEFRKSFIKKNGPDEISWQIFINKLNELFGEVG
ncbi:MAG TPA: hypothetical protein VER35_02050 [Candidatus Limnocylindrales bacterium]|nr:hypothetical protein [Candidatus Limnocylindrales bacterium]